MTPLRVLLPLALLVAVTLAEFPSSNQIRYYGKETSDENGILWPGNPAIENTFDAASDSNNPAKDENKGEIKTPAASKPSVDDKKDEIKTPAASNPSVDDKKDEIKTPAASKPSEGEKKDEDKTPVANQPSEGEKKDENKTSDPSEPSEGGKKDEIKTPAASKPSEGETKDENKTSDANQPSEGGKKDEIKTPAASKPSEGEKKDENKTSDANKPSEGDKKDEDKTSVAATPSDASAYRLPTNVVPKHYDIDLTVDQLVLPAKNSKYDGVVDITFVTTETTRVIKFHLDRNLIQLKTIELEDATGKSIKVEEKPANALTVNICELTASEDLTTGKDYTLKLTYEGTVNDKSRGFYKGSYLNSDGVRRWYAATHFEPIGARSAFPCFDEPSFKATFKITITHSTGYEAISNTDVEESKNVGKDKRQVTFKITPRMSTYLVAFAITDFDKTGKNVKVYSRKEVVKMGEYAAEVGDKVLKLLEEFTGIPYELKMDQIALPLLSPGAMENWGLVTYRETALLYDKDLNATIDQQKVANIIAHEFAHQWFGNLVSPKWWEFIWLNEGFATYFQYYIADKINPAWHYMEQFNSGALQGTAFPYDADLKKTRSMDHDVSKESEIGDLFDSIAYQKAGSVIRMFSHVLGETAFKKGLQTYLGNKKLDAATSTDLFKAFDEVVDKKVLPEAVNVETIFGNWAKQKGYPVITVSRNKDKAFVVKQEPFYFVKASDEDDKTRWYVPLNFVQDGEKIDFEDTAVTDWLKPDQTELIISKNVADGWAIFNKQQTGYYRVNYDVDNWNAIADYLKGENYTKIHPLNRAQLVDDALNLAKAGKLNYTVALNLIDYLNQETDYIVWKSAFGVLSTLNKLLATTEYYSEFSKYLVTMTETLLLNVTTEIKEDEPYLTKLLRVDALKWACDLGSVVCRTYARVEVNAWLSNENKNGTLPRDLGKILLCAAVRNSTFEEWNELFVKYVTSTNTDEKELILSALGCSLSPEILEYLLNLTVQPDSIFAGRVLQVFQGVYTNSPAGVLAALDFVDKNLYKLMTYDSNFDVNVEKYINELGSRIARKEDVHKLTDIVAKLGLPEEKTQKALDIANYNNKWFEANSQEVNNFFETRNSVTEPPPLPMTTKGGSPRSMTFTTLLLAAPIALATLR